jgi:hypothetical protein
MVNILMTGNFMSEGRYPHISWADQTIPARTCLLPQIKLFSIFANAYSGSSHSDILLLIRLNSHSPFKIESIFHIEMQARPLSCTCGNLRIFGSPLPSRVYPNIPSTERARFVACQHIRSCPPRSVEIRDPSNVSPTLHSAVCTDVHCDLCNDAFRFFCGRSFAYVGKVAHHAAGTARKSLPSAITALLARRAHPGRAAPSADVDPEDIDSEVMFASQSDPVVGSYKPEMIGSIEDDVGPAGQGSSFAPTRYHH